MDPRRPVLQGRHVATLEELREEALVEMSRLDRGCGGRGGELFLQGVDEILAADILQALRACSI